MSKKNVVLMKMANESLKGKWGLAIGTFLIFMLITGISGSINYGGSLISLLLSGPLTFGISIFSLNISRRKEAAFEQLFSGFDYFGKTLATFLLRGLFILLWLLLLIVPGIIAALSYSMTFYILADNNSLKPLEALEKSKQMMDGYKLKLFYLFLRFFLLGLLCILTLGIGFLWLIPFANVTVALFYDDIKEKKDGFPEHG